MAESTDKIIGANVKRLREEAGLKQSALVDKLRANGMQDWHATTLSRTENGERPLRLAEAEHLADALGAEVGELLARTPGLGVLRDIERATVDLHLHGIGIGNAVLAYLSKQDEVRAMLAVLPPMADDVPDSVAERWEQVVSAAEYQVSVPYQWHADSALVPDDEDRPYDPERDGKGWGRGVDPEAS